MDHENKYIIIREDLLQDPVTLISEGVLIGRLLQCELLLNHPAVSRAHAGIKKIDGTYYVFPLRPSNPVILNGKAIEENEALASGDTLDVGPFRLDIDSSDQALIIKVSFQIGMADESARIGLPNVTTSKLLADQAGTKRSAKPRGAPLASSKALDIFWDKRIREAGKMMRPSALFPKGQRRAGKAQFNWTPTTDLASRWPGSFFIWGALIVGLLSVAAAYWYASAYAPAPISNAHSKTKLELMPAIATQPNAASCTSCHSLRVDMQTRCAGCHNTEAFVPTVTKEHQDAGIGCASCHTEHRGSDFSPTAGALASCSGCHNDSNKSLYNGKQVHTAHGGTFGYPVRNGQWQWKGLNDEDWALKKIAITRLPVDDEQRWRSKQFHAIHVQRVHAVPGIPGNAVGQLSCSSCHKTFDPIDRETPKTRCGACHNGLIQAATNRVLISSDRPNCNSCHVQHVKDKRHWNPSLMGEL